MLKKFLAFLLSFLCSQKFTKSKILIFIAKALLNVIFSRYGKNKKLSAENIFIFLKLIADMNKSSRKRG